MKTRILLSLTLSLLLAAILLPLPASVLAADAVPGNALEFDGTDDRVSIPSSTSLGVGSEGTIEVWAKMANWNTDGDNNLVNNNIPYTGSNSLYLSIHPTVGLHFRYGGTSQGGEKYLNYASSDAWAADSWHHIAATWKREGATTYLYLYADGVQVDSDATTLEISLSSSPWNIGGYPIDPAWFDGMMDEVRIWNAARTTAQLREDMHRTLSGSESGLAAYYQLNASSGTTASDAAGSNDGTLQNMTDGDWVASTVPIGGGASATQVVSDTGPVDFTGAGLSMDFTAKVGTDTFVVTRIGTAPNVNPGLDTVFDSQYWVVNTFGSGTFSADLTFTVGEDLTAGDESDPSGIKLSQRESNADGVWTSAGAATGVNAAANTATFDDVAAFSQFILGREDPLVTSFLPSDDATGVARNANLIVTFDRSVTAGSGNVTIKRTADDAVFETLAASATSISGPEVTIDPTGDFDFATGYYVLIDGDAFHDGSGHYYAGISDKPTWNFETTATGLFTDIAAGLPGVFWGSVAWGDTDNDGDLDILLTGSYYNSGVYRNNGDDTFSDIAAGLPGVYWGSVAWGDYDNDGDLDILLTGDSDEGYISRVYRNDGGVFTDISAGLPRVKEGSVAWGDYDNDGDLDILLTGKDSYSNTISRVYRNDGGAFTDIAAGLTGVAYSSVAWGDYDNDGDLDILLTGNSISRVYRNDGGVFTDISAGLTGVRHSSVAWGDYDNDGDLDILLTGGYYDGSSRYISRVYRNNTSTSNTVPSAPTGLSATAGTDSIAFGWNAATDSETPSEGLTYNLWVGASAGGVEVSSPMADLSNGYRRVAQLGNANHNLTWTIGKVSYPQIHAYWSVQAVDHAFAGSAFAPTEDLGVEYLTVYNNDEMAPDDVLTWEVRHLNDVETYRVQIDDDPGFGSPAVDDALSPPTGQPKIAAGGGVTYSIPLNELPDYENLSDDTAYHWRMKPNYKDWWGTTVFTDQARSFFFNKANTAPTAPTSGFTPAGDVAIGTLAPVIAWDNAADPDSLSDHPGTLRATIEVATSNDFSTVVFSATTDPGKTAVEITPDLSDANRYYYRIKTMDDEGEASDWSSIQHFRTNTASTVFAQPSGSPKVAATQTFSFYGEDAAWVHWGAGGTAPDSLGLTLTPGAPYFNLPSGANAVSRYWTFDPVGGSRWTATVRLYYDDAELGDPPIPEALLRIWKTDNSGNTWDEVPVTARNVAENWVEGAVTSFSDFVLTGEDTSLPVTFSSFTAQAGDGQVTLHWVTESEVDNLGFHVVRALEEEGEYERLTADLIEGAGTSTNRRAYAFTDLHVTNGARYWYKIEAVASDGATTLYGPIPVTPRTAEPVRVEALPTAFGLSQNFPNPFNPTTEIRYQLPEASEVRLTVYDLLGQRVRVLVDGFVHAGYRTTVWDARGVGSGLYFVRMEAGEFVETRKMVLLR